MLCFLWYLFSPYSSLSFAPYPLVLQTQFLQLLFFSHALLLEASGRRTCREGLRAVRSSSVHAVFYLSPNIARLIGGMMHMQCIICTTLLREPQLLVVDNRSNQHHHYEASSATTSIGRMIVFF